MDSIYKSRAMTPGHQEQRKSQGSEKSFHFPKGQFNFVHFMYFEIYLGTLELNSAIRM